MTEHATDLPVASRLAALLDHFGLEHAHFATQMPGDLSEFSALHSSRIAGLALAVPVRLDPAPFSALANRILIITGDSGVSMEPSQRAAAQLDGATLVTLAGYSTTGWSDIARERTDELLTSLLRHLQSHEASLPRRCPTVQGVHAGIRYRVSGSGPALILMPFFLAASQWDPAVAALAEHFTVISIGGAHVGGIAILEERAAHPSYQAMFRSLTDFMKLGPRARVLDVGCGSGALDRTLAKRLGPSARIDAIDINAYLRSEAEALAKAERLDGSISFTHGSAEAIPFSDNTFDAVFSVTVLEECDAGRAIAEITRVVKPGGYIGIIVRAIDMPQWWNLDVPPAIRSRAFEPPQSVGRGGVADKSLYARMLKAGLTELVPFPSLVTLDQPGNSVWRYREDHLVGLLSAEERDQWQSARNAAATSSTLFQAHPMHCAVARKP